MTAPPPAANVLVNMTKSIELLDKVRNHIVEGFVRMTAGGVLGDEPLRGVRVNLVDAKIHSDSAHRGASQISAATVRALRAGLFTATPSLLEPLYFVEIEVPSHCNEAMDGVFSTFGMVRGEVLKVEDRSDCGIPLSRISGEVPIVETLRKEQRSGFTELLRQKTKGTAFAVMRFSRWKRVEGDPLTDGTMANELVLALRKRKGFKLEMPSFHDFHDKI